MMIPQFAKVWKRDKTKGKDKAVRHFTFIYFYCSSGSPYARKSQSDRLEMSQESAGVKVDLKKDDVLKEAVTHYDYCTKTRAHRMIENGILAMEKTMEKMVDKAEEGTMTSADHGAIAKLSTTIVDLQNLESTLMHEAEIKKTETAQGGLDISPFESEKLW